MRKRVTRREFIAVGAMGSAAAPLGRAASLPIDAAVATESSAAGAIAANPTTGAWLRWLDGSAPTIMHGVTWGMPWPRGKHKDTTHFALRDNNGDSVPLQSWPLAYWPDETLKWTAHAVPADQKLNGPFEIIPELAPAASGAIQVRETDESIDIDTGAIQCRLSKTGAQLIRSMSRGSRELLRDGRLVLLSQDQPAVSADGAIEQHAFESAVDRVIVEQRGPIRAVVKIEGRHANAAGRHWLPFTVRFYFYSGSDTLRVMHSIVFDGDESRDFIRGIGLRFSVPLNDALHDRHVRFAGEHEGVFAEAVRGLTGLRRNPGDAVKRAQVAGVATPPISTFAQGVGKNIEHIPAFGDWTLLQTNADSFAIRKRTRDGYSWLDANLGRRATGLGYVGGPSGGVAFGIRNFWQSYPAQLDIRHAETTAAEVTLWVWAPDAPAMDLRFYHDGLGQDTYEKQAIGLDMTYEDYEPGFGTAVGVARTSELTLTLLPNTPAREQFAKLAAALRAPPQLAATPQTLLEAGVFASSFSLPDRTSLRSARIEDQLDWLFNFYRSQQDQRSWYGFWNYGDVMHTYDADRHTWRYDVGGFAWDNSELSTDIWLWLYFLRTGRADVFRFAEAMTRHTGEVDVHHLGRFAPLGSRHNVMHWGCSAKQLRISTAMNRRYYYYLTGDERVGDLLREQVEAARTLRTIVPGRKVSPTTARLDDATGDYAHVGFGTDWGSLAGAWLTEWERTRDAKSRDRLLAGMRTIAAQPKGFFSSGSRMHVGTGAFDIKIDLTPGASHLSAAFGLPEVCAELIELLPVAEFENAWLQYCRLYNATAEEQRKALGRNLGPLNLGQGHARLTAYAAHRKQDTVLAHRAWREFFAGRAGFSPDQSYETKRVAGTDVLNPIDEAPWVSTNSAAQWGLAAIECLAFVARELPRFAFSPAFLTKPEESLQ